MKRRPCYTLAWSGQDPDSQLVTIYQKPVKDGDSYHLRALVHQPMPTAVGVFAEVTFSETIEDLRDTHACHKQISRWCNQYGWRKAAPVEKEDSHALSQQSYLVS